ncbi:MAG: ABC transporter permease [Bacteroidetes bacterium]|nr:MAG: ABC transporter permease [Bacteroidota bacterium]
MNLPLHIARRYLFAKKSTNVINIITGIAVFGISVGTAALILVLSVFNGFEDLITSMYSYFNPDVKVAPVQGKFFEASDSLLAEIKTIPGVEHVSETMEEVAVFEYKDNNAIGVLFGVDEHYRNVLNIDSTVREGSFKLYSGRHHAVLGLGMRNKLGVNINDEFAALNVYMPKRKKVGLFEPMFVKRFAYPSGTFMIQPEFDNQYIFTSLAFARELLGIGKKVSSLQIKLAPGFDIPETLEAIQEIVGPDYTVKNKYQQQESFLKLMQVEKWLSFAIVGLMMLLISFNMIGALWMIVLEKQKDISILKSMGATSKLVRNIFLFEGLLLTGLGIIIGFVLAWVIYFLQRSVGIINVPGDFIIDAYPMSMQLIDFIVVAVIVGIIGLLVSIAPARRAMKVPAMMREE